MWEAFEDANVHTRGISIRLLEIAHQSGVVWVASGEDNWNFLRGRCRCPCRSRAPGCGDDIHPPTDQVSRERRKLINLAVRPAILNCDVPAVVAGFFQAPAERSYRLCKCIARSTVEK